MEKTFESHVRELLDLKQNCISPKVVARRDGVWKKYYGRLQTRWVVVPEMVSWRGLLAVRRRMDQKFVQHGWKDKKHAILTQGFYVLTWTEFFIIYRHIVWLSEQDGTGMPLSSLFLNKSGPGWKGDLNIYRLDSDVPFRRFFYRTSDGQDDGATFANISSVLVSC